MKKLVRLLKQEFLLSPIVICAKVKICLKVRKLNGSLNKAICKVINIKALNTTCVNGCNNFSPATLLHGFPSFHRILLMRNHIFQ